MQAEARKTLFSSNKHDWETPQWLFEQLNAEFNFALDAAANGSNAKYPRYYDRNSLALPWTTYGNVFLNPPYGRDIGGWLEKAFNEGQLKNAVVCLIPSRTDTKYWHSFVMKADEIRFIRGRLKFVGASNGAPFPSCIVIFRRNNRKSPLCKSLEQ